MPRTLLIPDIHQDLLFLSRLLDRENLDTFDQIIFLGDYFDPRSEAFAGEQATRMIAQFLHELVKAHPKKVRLLWGNHDIIYCRLREYVLRVGQSGIEKDAAGQPELMETFKRALWINEVWPGEMWFRLELAILQDDWLISHAGIHPEFWPDAATPEDALSQLQFEWEGVIGNLFENEDHPLLEAGQARGGQQTVGGPVWLDWDNEFVDELPYRQIVGHSAGPKPRQKGRSWCIDCGQLGYGVLESGDLQFISLNDA